MFLNSCINVVEACRILSNLRYHVSTTQKKISTRVNMSLRSRRNLKRIKSSDNEVNPSIDRNYEDPSTAADDEISVGTYSRRSRQSSKKPCLNRNALMARANRQRKKAYLEKIENKLSFYQQENQELSNTVQKQMDTIKRLSSEVTYLKNVLNNNSAITILLKALNRGLSSMNNERKKRTGVNHCVNVPSTSSDELRGNFVDGIRYNDSYKDSVVKDVAYSVPNLDHTYMSTNVREIESTKALGVSDLTCQTKIDSYTDSKDSSSESFLSARTDKLCNVDMATKDNLSPCLDLDQLPTFNDDLFEDLPKYDEAVSSVDSLQDTPNFFKEEELFQNLNDAGICLHVNNDRVLLQYCNNCHSNSTNSEID